MKRGKVTWSSVNVSRARTEQEGTWDLFYREGRHGTYWYQYLKEGTLTSSDGIVENGKWAYDFIKTRQVYSHYLKKGKKIYPGLAGPTWREFDGEWAVDDESGVIYF